MFRPDWIIHGVKNFIINYFKGSDYYVISPTISYKKIFNWSSENYPIMFILSPGADPISDV